MNAQRRGRGKMKEKERERKIELMTYSFMLSRCRLCKNVLILMHSCHSEAIKTKQANDVTSSRKGES